MASLIKTVGMHYIVFVSMFCFYFYILYLFIYFLYFKFIFSRETELYKKLTQLQNFTPQQNSLFASSDNRRKHKHIHNMRSEPNGAA